MNQPVDSKTVTGRRKLQFATIEDVLADAEQLASGPCRQLGNWSLGEIYDHLAKALDSATDDNQFAPPLLFKIIGRLMKKRFLGETLTPGFKMPVKMEPIFMPESGVDDQEGLSRLRRSIERFQAATLPDRSPMLGKMTRDQWHAFHCRHAEMHLSFLVPGNSPR